MSRSQPYDVLGAGGGTLSRHLAPSRRRSLLLERGDYVPRQQQDREVAPP